MEHPVTVSFGYEIILLRTAILNSVKFRSHDYFALNYSDELAVDFIFTFKLKNDDKDKDVTDIYLYSIPYKVRIFIATSYYWKYKFAHTHFTKTSKGFCQKTLQLFRL